MGARSTKNGALFEVYIGKENKALKGGGLAYVSKNFEAPKVDGKHKRRSKSKPDFSGFLPNGKSVVFEAKSTQNKTRFDLGGLKDHQFEHLKLAESCGCVSFLYVLNGLAEKYVFTVANIEETLKVRKSLRFDIYADNQKRNGETWLETYKRITAEK